MSEVETRPLDGAATEEDLGEPCDFCGEPMLLCGGCAGDCDGYPGCGRPLRECICRPDPY